MTARTYDELFAPPIRLSLAPTGGGYTVQDQHGHDYVLSPSPLTFCVRFMQALAERGDATLDEASVEAATWHSVKVPDGALSERDTLAAGMGLTSSPAVQPSRSENALDNLRPIRHVR